jgi:gliding motility-associatede transport system auxiliary component
MQRRSAALYGILGLIALLFAAFAYFVAAGFRPYIFINLIAGVFLIIMWISAGWAEVGTFVGRRSTQYGANAIVYSAIFVAILIAVNYLSNQHHRRLDMSEQHVYSLSSQSVNVVKNLKKPLKLYGFFQGGDNPTALELYQEYAYASPNVTYQMVDPDRNPELAERYKVSALGTTHLQYGPEDTGEGTNITEVTEEALTNAIIRVSKATRKTVYFLDGEGEGNPDDATEQNGYGTIKTALEGEGFDVKKLVLATQAAVPDDCTILIVAGPVKPLDAHEIDAIGKYLDGGGRALITLRAPKPDNEIDEAALIKLVGQWGIDAGNDIVVDQVTRLFAAPALGVSPLVQNYGTHPITRDFNQRTIFPMSRSVTPVDKPKDGMTVTALAMTSDTSWGETDIDGIFKRQEAKLDPADKRGPIDVADAIQTDPSKNPNKKETRIVVIGSTDAGDNQWAGQLYNRDFFVNCADWLSGEENQISIRPKQLRSSRFRLTAEQFTVVFILSVLLLPELLLIVGIVVWWERRN